MSCGCEGGSKDLQGALERLTTAIVTTQRSRILGRIPIDLSSKSGSSYFVIPVQVVDPRGLMVTWLQDNNGNAGGSLTIYEGEQSGVPWGSLDAPTGTGEVSIANGPLAQVIGRGAYLTIVASAGATGIVLFEFSDSALKRTYNVNSSGGTANVNVTNALLATAAQAATYAVISAAGATVIKNAPGTLYGVISTGAQTTSTEVFDNASSPSGSVVWAGTLGAANAAAALPSVGIAMLNGIVLDQLTSIVNTIIVFYR